MSVHARRRRSTDRSRVLAAADGFAVGLALSWSFATVTIQENALARDIDATKASIASEQARNAQPQASLEGKKATDYVIKEAEQLGMGWPLEVLIAVPLY